MLFCEYRIVLFKYRILIFDIARTNIYERWVLSALAPHKKSWEKRREKRREKSREKSRGKSQGKSQGKKSGKKLGKGKLSAIL